MLKKILLFLLVILIIIQFIHPKRNKTNSMQTNYIGKMHTVPEDVHSILAKACLDCHSNNTRYPWYTKFQPFDWWITGHINDGKKGLNFDEFNNKSLRFQYNKMKDVVEQIKKDEMPLNSYLWIHKDAKLTADEKSKLINWATAIMDSMKAKYPIDSLVRKKQP
ncbi:MAG TPA: heme-binding domain-containing protein [Chitinophagaceae bacterium]|nr:heme-binding domain-containing protein [Chitinophagaceae bacterium]